MNVYGKTFLAKLTGWLSFAGISKSSNYLLFAGTNCYPKGGADDFIGSYATIKQAKLSFLKLASSGKVSDDSPSGYYVTDLWGHITDAKMTKICDGRYFESSDSAEWRLSKK